MSDDRYEIKPPYTNESFVWIFKNGKPWMGQVERTIAIEIVNLSKAARHWEDSHALLNESLNAKMYRLILSAWEDGYLTAVREMSSGIPEPGRVKIFLANNDV